MAADQHAVVDADLERLDDEITGVVSLTVLEDV